MKISMFSIILIFLAYIGICNLKDDKKKEIARYTGGNRRSCLFSPQTGIRVHIKATRERFVCGPFYMYAQKMLGIDNAPSDDGDQLEHG